MKWIIILLFSSSVFAQPLDYEIKPFNVTIEYDRIMRQDIQSKLDIFYEGEPSFIKSFEFSISYDKNQYKYFEILTGDSVGCKNWDEFKISKHIDTVNNSIEIVNFSGSLNNAVKFNTGDKFAIIEVRPSDDRTLGGSYLPIKFNLDSEKNIVTLEDGLNYTVNYHFTKIRRVLFKKYYQGQFYNYSGSKNNKTNDSLSIINFYDGGIKLYMNELITGGDLNLNSITFELDDLLLFKEYLIKGLDVFDLNLEGQIANTDINRDGISLGLFDFVFMMHLVNGASLDYSYNFKKVAINYTHNENGKLSINDVLYSAMIEVEGNVVPSLIYKNLEIDFHTDSNKTKILIYSTNCIPFTGDIVKFKGKIISFDYISTTSFHHSTKITKLPSKPIIRLIPDKEGYYLINIYKEDAILYDKAYGYFTPGEYFINVDIPEETFDNYDYDIIYIPK